MSAKRMPLEPSPDLDISLGRSQSPAPAQARPAVRDAEATKRRILKGARQEFARHGLSGARVETIARAAKTNKRMLYHYFGNKEALFLATLESTYDHIRAAERTLNLEALEPLAAIEALVRFTWDYFVTNPEFLALLNNENLHRGRNLKRSKHVGQMNSPVIATISTILARGTKSGTIRAGIDPLQLYISIASLCYFYLSNIHTLTIVFGRDLKQPSTMRERVEHIVEFTLAAVRAQPT